ncbi:MAG: hypothetical protein WC926_03035 [Candidatus Paceibacterota bacterium]|jgi:hypothetical protein
METKTAKIKFERLNLPKSLERQIRNEKSAIRKTASSVQEKARLVDELYKKVLRVKKAEPKKAAAKK